MCPINLDIIMGRSDVPLLIVPIPEARGPSKSDIKYKSELYAAIFIYSLLLHSV